MPEANNILNAFRLDGQVALVTGASRGIGKALALALAAAGADVAVAGREEATLAPVVGEIEALGQRSLAVPLDVADVEAIPGAVNAVVEGLGSLDILVNNAGLNIRKDSLDYTPDDWDFVMNANLKGTFFLTQAAGKRMVEQGRGKILNIGSMSAFLGLPTLPAYSSS